MTVLSLGFLTDEYNQIKELLYSLGLSSNEEFELRFGKLDKTFDTNFSQTKFLSIVNNLDFLNIHKKKEHATDTVEYKGRYRKITLLKKNINGVESTEKVSPIYENKIKGKNIDINVVGEIYEDNTIMKGVKSTLRFSSSKEQEITEKDWNNSSEKVNLSVKRIRTTYFMDNYKVDLTAKYYDSRKIVFEIEAEFNNDYIKSIIVDEKGFIKFMTELKTVLGFVYSSSTIYSEYYFNSISSEINSIRYPADIRPKNISDEDVLNTKLQGYAVTNKLDGVGYSITFVQITLNGTELIVLVAYNSTDIFSISTIKANALIPEEKKILKSFSKAEIKYVNKVTQVHFFDNLLYGNERTFEKDLFMRLNKAIEINNICIKHFSTASVPVSYEVKSFEIPRGDIIDSMKSVINKMSDRYDVFDLVEYNDGIIFQPLGPYSKAPALKWKFPSKVTIDFLFRKDYENDNLITYKLCSKTRPGNFIQFKDDITGIEHSITVCKKEMFDGILGSSLEEKVVEVGVHNNEWSIHRIRFDKVPEKTNHIKTAQATFIDIIYQFTLPYLEELIKYSKGQGQKPVKQRIDIKVKKQETVEITENSQGLPKEHFPKGKEYIISDELKKMTMEKNNEILSFIKDSIKELKYPVKGIIDINPLTGSTSMTFTNFFEYVYAVRKEDDTSLDANFNLFYKETNKELYIIDEYENVNNYKANILFINNLFEGKNIDNILDKFSNFLIIVASKKNLQDYSYFNEFEGMKLYAFYNPKKSLENLRLMANRIKKEMIESTRDKVVVDIGSGVGGDLFKYSKSETKEIFLIEPSSDNIKTLNIRAKEGSKFLKKLPYKVLNAGGEETKKICSFVNKKVDFVNMFFSLTFFFKNRDMLMNLVNTIDCLLKDDGVFMGTVMDGNLVERELDKDDIITKDYEIKKVSVEGKKGFYNKEVSIDFKNTVTATYQTEYLVFLKEFEFLLSSKGINLEKIMNFNEYDTQSLSKEEKFLNGLYSMFVFKKTGVLRNSKLNLVPIHKNKEFINEYWYRASSPPDGSCLFHSVVMNLLGDEAGPQIAYDIRTVLSKTLTLEEYTNIQDGNLAIIKLHEILLENISVSCFNRVPNDIDDKELKNKVEKIIEKYSKYGVYEFRNEFIKELVEEGFDKEEVKEVFKGFYLSTYLKFSENIANPNYWADQSMILLLAEKLKINIVLISSRTLEVYDYADGKYNPDYVSIVLLYIDNAHFEPLCKKISPYDEKCQYTFSLDEMKSII